MIEMQQLEPVIEEFPTDISATEREGILLKVVVKGQQQPYITWYHNGTELSPGNSHQLQQDGSLTITSAEPKHSGIYKLLANNSNGSDEREVRVTVKEEEVVKYVNLLVEPIPTAEFGDYVAKNHSHSDEDFRLQYYVCVCIYITAVAISICCYTQESREVQHSVRGILEPERHRYKFKFTPFTNECCFLLIVRGNGNLVIPL